MIFSHSQSFKLFVPQDELAFGGAFKNLALLTLRDDAALLDTQEYHLRQVAIGITRGKEGNGIGGNKHGSADLDGCLCRSKGVVLDDALVGIVVNQMAATQRIGKRERHIMLQDMPITRHIDPL